MRNGFFGIPHIHINITNCPFNSRGDQQIAAFEFVQVLQRFFVVAQSAVTDSGIGTSEIGSFGAAEIFYDVFEADKIVSVTEKGKRVFLILKESFTFINGCLCFFVSRVFIQIVLCNDRADNQNDCRQCD